MILSPVARAVPAPSRRRGRLLALMCGLLAVLAPAAAAQAAQAGQASTRTVRYDGWQARVPASWPVLRLGARSHTCVRFDRHAVYLGRPGAAQDCPPAAVGRTEAVLVSPHSATGAGAHSATSPAAGVPTTGAVAQRATGRVLVTVTWNRDPAAVRPALGADSVRAAGRAYDRRVARSVRAAAAHGRAATRALSGDAIAHTASSPGTVYTGLGFDACSTPSQATMSDWASSPFRAIGVYLGGANMACNQANLTATWVAAQADAGWHLIPLYVGLQAPGNGCGCASISTTNAAAQGTAAAQSAIQEAAVLGLGAGNPVYYDMENYSRTTTASDAVLTFLGAWTSTLHAAHYRSGVYSSELSGIKDLVAEQGTGYAEPDDIWTANWNGQQSTIDGAIPSTDWAAHQRLHQYEGGHTDNYGGASISIDSDYVDAATASPGSGTVTTSIASAPSLAVRPQPDGTLRVSPTWRGQTGVSRWQVVAGASPTALATIGFAPAAKSTLVARDAYPYFQVEAYNAAGQELGLSGTVATPSHVAMFGRSAFVASRGPGGLPVECYGIPACRVSTTITSGHTRLAATGPERVPAGGGIVHFPLSGAVHRLVTRAGNAGLPVTVTVRSSTGRVATRTMKLVRFSASGRGPRRVAGSGAQLAILGVTDFVSHGWSGGILVACRRLTPCAATPAVRIGATRVATARAQTIGAGEIGYLSFQMTAAGHARLMRARGNQLGVSVSLGGSAAGLATPVSAHALIALDAF